MEAYPKFIIETDDQEGDCLIIGKCTYHKQLVTDKTKVRGGGWWNFNDNKTEIHLYGKSEDFGYAKFEDILNCIKNKKVFSSSVLVRNISDRYKFFYRNDYYELIELK